MSKLRKIAALFILFEIICLIFGNIYVGKVYSAMNTRAYKVDISRIKTDIEAGKQLADIDYTEYERVIKVSEFDPNEQTKNEYAVELINDKLYRFEYNKVDMSKVLLVLTVTYIMIIVLTIIVFLYLEKKIINPFTRMNSITTELSKGNLAVPIKQEKSKYFKDFLWGLDMLRDKLEGDRQRELELLN